MVTIRTNSYTEVLMNLDDHFQIYVTATCLEKQAIPNTEFEEMISRCLQLTFVSCYSREIGYVESVKHKVCYVEF